MRLSDYRPKNQLVTVETRIEKPRFPVIDFHNHLEGFIAPKLQKSHIPEIINNLESVGVRKYVDLDGGWGEEILQRHLEIFKDTDPERFLVFGGVDWSEWANKGNRFPEWAAGRLQEQSGWGARGLKIWKGFGLDVNDSNGKLVAVDDTRLEPIWQTAGELNLPVLIHVADPVAFFEPLDHNNERWEELTNHPDWHFPSPPYPPFLSIVNSMARVVQRNPNTKFIGAHVGWYAENLNWVGSLLERYPNFYIDIGARISELGRQPYTSKKFFSRFADRILFGTDAGPNPDYYRIYYRFLESEDEYFNYNPGDIPHQGRWQIYGLSLPNEILEKIYYKNAERILFDR